MQKYKYHKSSIKPPTPSVNKTSLSFLTPPPLPTHTHTSSLLLYTALINHDFKTSCGLIQLDGLFTS